MIAVIFCSENLSAQNSKPRKDRKEKVKRSNPKGDKPGRRNPKVKETRFKMRTKKGDKAVNRDPFGKKVKKNRRSSKPAGTSIRTNRYYQKKTSRERPRSSSPPKRIKTASRKGERSTGKDISGRKVRATTTKRPRPNYYSAPNPFTAKPKKPREGKSKYRSPNIRSRTGRDRRTQSKNSAPNIRSRTGNDQRARRSVSGKRISSPRSASRTFFSGTSVKAVKSTSPKQGKRARSYSKKQNPVKSVSGNIRNKRPANPFAVANTKRKRKGEVAINKDIAGKRLKDKRSPRQHITTNAPNPYTGTTYALSIFRLQDRHTADNQPAVERH